MADEITIGSKAIKEVQDLRAELIKLSQDALNAGKTLSSISTPGMLNKSGGDNANASAQLDTFKTKYIALSETIQKNAEKSRLAEIRLQQQREKAFDKFEKQSAKEANAYNKTQAQINKLTQAYNDLAVRKERYNNLSANEETRLNTLQKVTEKYNGTLKTVDAQIGKNGRNVGNYASGYNALGNSINQLTREAPAFANSVNTGFMAISNNLPMLFDAISGIKKELKEAKEAAMSDALAKGALAREQAVLGGATEEAADAISEQTTQLALSSAEGVRGRGVLRQLAGAFFSWGTALSLAVTLLTVYGGKIIEYISGNKKAADSAELLANAQKEATEGSVKEISHLETLRAKVTNVNAPMSERLKIVKELQDQYPSYFGNLTTEQILADKTSGAYEQLTKDILASAKARAIAAEIEKIAVKQLALETEIALNKTGQRNLKNALNLNILEQLKDVASGGGGGYARKAIIANQEKELQELNKAQQALIDKYVLIDTGKLGEDGKDEPPKITKQKKERRDDIEGLKSHLKTVGLLKDEIDAEINRLTTERITGDKEALPAVNVQLELLIKLRKQLNDLPEADVKIVNNVKTATIAIRELSEETKRYLKSFIDDFSSNAGLKNLIDSFDINDENSLFSKIKDGLAFTKENWQATTVDIVESVQEMYNFISNASQANFDAEKERLQSQYDVAIGFANGNKEAEEKLANDLEARKKDIANREAKAKKQQAIYNIAIDTAQAVVAALPNFVLAGIIAAFGVAQAVIVSSQKVPQFWMGGTHEGGLMMVNDGGGSNWKETFVTPDGKVHQASQKNAIIDAPAGTEIFTHDQWLAKQREISLHNMLKANNINMFSDRQPQGMTKDDFYEVMSNTLGGQTIERSNLDANGFSKYTIKRGNMTRRINNRANGKSNR